LLASCLCVQDVRVRARRDLLSCVVVVDLVATLLHLNFTHFDRFVQSYDVISKLISQDFSRT
jgi:hypothetical protein